MITTCLEHESIWIFLASAGLGAFIVGLGLIAGRRR